MNLQKLSKASKAVIIKKLEEIIVSQFDVLTLTAISVVPRWKALGLSESEFKQIKNTLNQ